MAHPICRNCSWPDVEVLDVDVFVGGGLPLAPEEETFLGRHLLDWDVLDGETQDDGPDHAQGHLDVAVDDFCKSKRASRLSPCRVILVVDQATGFTYLLRSGSGNRTLLPMSLHKLCALCICMSVSSCHPKTKKILDSSLPLLLYLTDGCLSLMVLLSEASYKAGNNIWSSSVVSHSSTAQALSTSSGLMRVQFLHLSLYCPLSFGWSFNRSFPCRLDSWLELGSQVGQLLITINCCLTKTWRHFQAFNSVL